MSTEKTVRFIQIIFTKISQEDFDIEETIIKTSLKFKLPTFIYLSCTHGKHIIKSLKIEHNKYCILNSSLLEIRILINVYRSGYKT